MEFLTEHGLDIFTTILGLLYIYYEYKASIWVWLLGILMPLIDIYLFSTNGMYAYAFISLVFALVAIYGILNWKYGGKNHTERQITCMTFKKICRYMIAMVIFFGITYEILVSFTDSEIPVLDSFTTAASFVGVFALAYKYVEQWIVWIVVDIISVIMFIQQGLPFRAGLYALYVLIAIAGYRKWKSMAKTFQ